MENPQGVHRFLVAESPGSSTQPGRRHCALHLNGECC